MLTPNKYRRKKWDHVIGIKNHTASTDVEIRQHTPT